jgi:hypothetical protein
MGGMNLPAPASRPIRIIAPSRRVLRVINPLVATILRSPVHGLLSQRVLLLTYTGRRTGRSHTTPVGYVQDGTVLTIFSVIGRWWKSLRGGGSVGLVLRGQHLQAHAEVIDDGPEMLEEVNKLVERYGPKEAGQRIGIALDITPPPSPEDLIRALDGGAVTRLHLE